MRLTPLAGSAARIVFERTRIAGLDGATVAPVAWPLPQVAVR